MDMNVAISNGTLEEIRRSGEDDIEIQELIKTITNGWPENR